MKKLTTATDLGGAPIYKSDLRDLFNVDIWNVLDGIFSAQFGADVQGVILSGCVVTNNAGNFDMTAGIVYLNGSFMRVPAVTNQAFTQYIKADTVVNDSRIFADGSTHNVMINTPAICAAGIPGSGQYITISSLTSADAQRWGKVFDSLVSTNIIRGLSANQGSVIAALIALKADKAQAVWTNLTLAGTWTNAGGTTARYRITSQNKLELAGNVIPGATAVVANLPNLTIPATQTIYVPATNITDGLFARMVLSGGSPTTIQIVGFIAAKQYELCCSVALDASN